MRTRNTPFFHFYTYRPALDPALLFTKRRFRVSRLFVVKNVKENKLDSLNLSAVLNSDLNYPYLPIQVVRLYWTSWQIFLSMT